MYTMYMKQLDSGEEYTVAEFRSNLRDALEAADDMVDVFVVRHGKRYFLCTEDYLKELLKPDTDIGLKPPPVAEKPKAPIIKSSEDVAEAVKHVFPDAEQLKYCKNGHPIPDGREKCLGKNCKWGA